MEDANMKALVEAIQDLTRVTVLVNGQFKNKAEAVRKLDEFGIPSGRIAGILGMVTKDVSSILAKAHKAQKESDNND